jgi:hypothetical protein
VEEQKDRDGDGEYGLIKLCHRFIVVQLNSTSIVESTPSSALTIGEIRTEAGATRGNRGRYRLSDDEGISQEHSPYLVNLQIEPRLDVLRSDPRFQTLVQRVGLGGLQIAKLTAP